MVKSLKPPNQSRTRTPSGSKFGPANDALLIEKAKNGDGRELYDAFAALVYQLSVSYRFRIPVEEAVSFGWIHFWRACLAYDPSMGLRLSTLITTYIYRGLIGENKYYGAKKRQRTEIRLSQINPKELDEELARSESFDSKLEYDLLDWDILTPMNAEILRMRYEQNMEYSEIGEKYGISRQAVQNRHKKSIAKFRERYENEISQSVG